MNASESPQSKEVSGITLLGNKTLAPLGQIVGHGSPSRLGAKDVVGPEEGANDMVGTNDSVGGEDLVGDEEGASDLVGAEDSVGVDEGGDDSVGPAVGGSVGEQVDLKTSDVAIMIGGTKSLSQVGSAVGPNVGEAVGEADAPGSTR
mmetsp:Transcript_6084/g.12542  ORF Transcript_6084/g.12542 Transcript_6084/m.12542 type:complete len:147 (-) Transcript_6084:387-827(-)